MTETATVHVVDDEAAVREALSSLVRAVGLQAQVYASADEFLDVAGFAGRNAAACILLDLRLPGSSGLEIQEALATADGVPPIIFITGHGDIPTSVRAMKGGAVEFLTKPFETDQLLAAIHQALERDSERLKSDGAQIQLKRRFTGLTERERSVFIHVTAGRPNKQIAADLGISEITVKLHRGRVMRKMNARSLADLVKMATRLGIN
jgi:FixJ family two-component response regulator